MREQLEKQWANDYLSEQPPEASQLDFMVGDWEMTRRAYNLEGDITDVSNGEMHAEKVLDGRIVKEGYFSLLPDGRIYRGGVGLHSYIPSTKQWVTASLDASVGANSTIHQVDGEELVYESTFEIAGATVHLRGRWHDIQPNSYVWDGSGSVDGESWFRTYEARFVRKE